METKALTEVVLDGASSWSVAQLSTALSHYLATTVGKHDAVVSAREICQPASALLLSSETSPASTPAPYPSNFFSACPSCALEGYSEAERVAGPDGKPTLDHLGSDGNAKLFPYLRNAGDSLTGEHVMFMGEPQKVVSADEANPTAAPIPVDKDGDVCDKHYKALDERRRQTMRGKASIQAAACVGTTLCSHMCPGRGSLVVAKTGA